MNRAEVNRVSIDAGYYGVAFPYERIYVQNSAFHTQETSRRNQTSALKYFLWGQRRWEILEDFIHRRNRSKVTQVSSYVERVRNGYDGIDPDTFSCWKRLLKKHSQAA